MSQSGLVRALLTDARWVRDVLGRAVAVDGAGVPTGLGLSELDKLDAAIDRVVWDYEACAAEDRAEALACATERGDYQW